MSRHQYIRNLDYQEAVDEYEGYSEEEDELSPEDRELMNKGTADVQAALGVEASRVTIAQIEEALWHYYYDVDKSVAYLIAKFINPPPKPTKPAAQQPKGKSFACAIDTSTAVVPLELGIPGHWARKYLDLTDAGLSAPQLHPTSSIARNQTAEPSSPAFGVAFEPRASLSHFFHDMPWGNIPKHRETTFIPPPMPRGGLLGGSGAPPKMSKLQALAAARKKKVEEKNINEKVERTRAKMNELSVEDAPTGKENVPLAGPFSKRLRTLGSNALGRVAPVVTSESAHCEQPQGPDTTTEAAVDEQATVKAQPYSLHQALPGSRPDNSKPDAPKDEPPVAKPSAFARVLCGLPPAGPTAKAPEDEPPTAKPSSFARAPPGSSPDAPEPSTPEDELPITQSESSASDKTNIFAGPLYGYDGQGTPPEKPSTSTDWFDIRKRKRDDSDEYEEVVVLFPNLPQSVRDAFTQPSPDDIVLAAQAKAKPKGSLLKRSMR